MLPETGASASAARRCQLARLFDLSLDLDQGLTDVAGVPSGRGAPRVAPGRGREVSADREVDACPSLDEYALS